jgi:hypothetical protein
MRDAVDLRKMVESILLRESATVCSGTVTLGEKLKSIESVALQLGIRCVSISIVSSHTPHTQRYQCGGCV